MRWLALTLALIGASAALIGGIYFRDRTSSSWLPPPREAAALDARTIIDLMACPGPCTYTVVRTSRAYHWVATIHSSNTSTHCYDIDLQTFDTGTGHGVSGVLPVACDRAGSAPDA